MSPTIANPAAWGYPLFMANPLRSVTADAMALDPADRLRLAAELIDSVEGSAEPGWSERWTTELRRRTSAAAEREAQGQPRGAEWSQVKDRLLDRLAQR